MQLEEYLVDYEHVLTRDEKSPKELDFYILVNKISQADNMPNSKEAILKREYAVRRSLIRVLEGGVEGIDKSTRLLTNVLHAELK